MKQKKPSMILAAAMMSSLALNAVTPLWLRDVKISPDGGQIAFTYKGDIYTVAASGGQARRLTWGDGYNTNPIWSPTGDKIAYGNNRHGTSDVFVINADGSGCRRLTSLSATEIPQGFSPDGRQVYFSAALQDPASSVSFPTARLTELYTVSLSDGKINQALATPALMMSWQPDGKGFVYQDVKGMESEWRKHHTSSTTRGIWHYDTATGRHTCLADHPGEDLNPVCSPDGKFIYFLSERDGSTLNVWKMLPDGSDVQPVTHFADHPVRFLSQAHDGTLAMTWDGEIYTMLPDGKPQKVAVDIMEDTYEAPSIQRFTSGAGDVAVSPDGKLLAFSRRGDIFVSSVEFGTTHQLTSTPWAESSPSWADGGRSLYFVSRQSGRPDIHKLEMTRQADPDMLAATSLRESTVAGGGKDTERDDAEVSPDGTKIAYVKDRSELWVMDLTASKATQLSPREHNAERQGLQYSWSPDSKWLVFTCVPHHHSPYYDIALVNADGDTPQTTFITQTGYFDESPRFSPDGTAITWLSERYGMRNHASWGSMSDVMAVYLTQEAYDRHNLSSEELAATKRDDKKEDKKKDVVVNVDRDGIEDRIVRLTPYSSSVADATLSPDGEKLYYLSQVENGYDMWELELRKGKPHIVNKLSLKGSPQFALCKDDLFILSSSDMRKMSFGGNKFTSISVSGQQKIDRAAERQHMLEYVRNEEREKFYTADMHGVQWDRLVDHYSKFMPHISNYDDFAELLSELLGELNVSHTGGYHSAGSADEATAELGLLFDLTWQGKGLKVAEVVKGGPFDRADSQLRGGDIITAINSTAVDAGNYTSVLNGLAGKITLIEATGKGGGIEQTVKPISRGKMNALLYDRWVKRNAAHVDSLSGGRLGYVHINQMADPAFRTMYADVLGKYNDRDGIVIDTRWNGGGRMHEDIEVLFSGHQYLTQKVRGNVTATMPSRRWNKLSVMIIGEANYSNAHGTPWVYKTMGIGKLVGMPVPGTMTSVNWVDLQEPSMYFGIPVIGYELSDGTYLENKQLEPDIKVANSPEHVAAGIDDQLDTAVRSLLRDIDGN